MDTLLLARLQFSVTTVYHFFFVPLTLGLSVLVAIMQTIYVRTGKDVYKRMTKFWGKLFLINFALGVVTGIIMEFQFGMNWSEYARFMGDIFGVPLAIEALLAFFLESTFIGIWIFGWDKLPKRVHLASIWLAAIGANLSALWILIANSFMHEPVGYALSEGRVVLTDFFALLTNPHVWVQVPHVLTSALSTGAFFILGISAWHLLRSEPGSDNHDAFRLSFRIGAIAAAISVLAVGGVGHAQAQHMVATQPMKMAAAEGLWESEDPAGLSLFTITSEAERRNIVDLRVPYLLSVLAYNRPSGEVLGINDIQAAYEVEYGPGNYTPPVIINYWSFRAMVGAGMAMGLLAALSLYFVFAKKEHAKIRKILLIVLPFAILLPYLANTTGWLLTEVGRQPWIVFGLMTVDEAVSPNVPFGSVLFSLIGFILIFGLLMTADIWLLAKYARKGAVEEEPEPVEDETPSLITGEPAAGR